MALLTNVSYNGGGCVKWMSGSPPKTATLAIMPDEFISCVLQHQTRCKSITSLDVNNNTELVCTELYVCCITSDQNQTKTKPGHKHPLCHSGFLKKQEL